MPGPSSTTPPELTPAASALGHLEAAVEERCRRWGESDLVDRIWEGDPFVWGGTVLTPELTDRLGWLDIAERVDRLVAELDALRDSVRRRFDRVVLLGMGGSGLAPAVMAQVEPGPAGSPSLILLDSTVPNAVRAAVPSGAEPFFVVSSKSGTTLETTSLMAYFWERFGLEGDRFAAVTDPDTPLDREARSKGFSAVFSGDPAVGGRFSALSPFGIVPAALAGVPTDRVVEGGREAMRACRASDPAANPGAWLGLVLAEAAAQGRNKLVLGLAPEVAALGLWIEQLVAESTGKGGVGVLPCVVDPDGYRQRVGFGGDDRVFVSIGKGSPADDAWVAGLEDAGQPVVAYRLAGATGLGAEFFRWAFATAVVSADLGVNPFDQPNVGESKANTQRVLDEFVPTETIPPKPDPSVFGSFLEDVGDHHYVAILAYVTPTPERADRLREVAERLSARTGRVVTWGYGPRYLHSTGQYHKGGPAAGHFLLVVELGSEDVMVPGRPFGFAELARAQAVGDRDALRARGRPVLELPSLARLEALAS